MLIIFLYTTMNSYQRLTIISVEHVFQAIRDNEKHIFIQEQQIGCNSLRILTFFNHGTKCVCCDINGTFFGVERQWNPISGKLHQTKYHINLYGYKSENDKDVKNEMMITSDHKIPKSLNGKDNLSNRQPMCMYHNTQKGNRLIWT
jgi:hypothetical protein